MAELKRQRTNRTPGTQPPLPSYAAAPNRNERLLFAISLVSVVIVSIFIVNWLLLSPLLGGVIFFIVWVALSTLPVAVVLTIVWGLR